MPSTSPAQARLMAAVAHGWKPSGMKGPSVKVAKEFNQADKGSPMLHRAMQRKAMGGRMMAAIRARMAPQMQNRGPIPPPSVATMPGPRPQMPPGGALAALRPGIGAMPMPAGGMRPMARGGGLLRPPGPLGAQNYMPQPSPLASLIGHGMAAMHRGNPGMRKPRIPLPGAMRNINQTINHAKTRLGSMNLG